jgi:uncharacterized protein (TIGR03435 family)
MTQRLANKLGFGHWLRRAAVGIAVIAGPVVFALINAPQVRAQWQPAANTPLPTFEVASIKRSLSGRGSGTSLTVSPNRFIARNYFMAYLIGIAYGQDLGEFGFLNVKYNQVVGGPSWIYPGGFDYEGYDIEAKVDDSVAEKFGKDCGPAFFRGSCNHREQILLMFQSLLADRFKLKVRRETRELPVYALVVAKGGPKFAATAPPDSAATGQNSTLPRAKRPPCPAGMSCVQRYISMDVLADIVSRVLLDDRPVIDQTGLKGAYYIKLQYSRELLQRPNAETDIAPPLGPSGPSIREALQQQLGLKLEPTKGPVEFLVVDHIERPSGN